MAYVKKISGSQFLFDIIQKELDIVGSGLKFKDFNEFVEWARQPEHDHWFSDYEFANKEQFYEWKRYFYDHFYDWQPKRVKKKQLDREFAWVNLQYGLKYGFDYRELYEDGDEKVVLLKDETDE